MKLVYQGPETEHPGDLRVYERPDGSIEEVRSRRKTVELFIPEELHAANPQKWERIAKELVTEQITADGDSSYGDYELLVTEGFGVYDKARNVDQADAVRIEVRQKYWPAVEGVES